MEIKFGTSGFRGVIAQNFTKQNVQKVAFAIAKLAQGDEPIPLGYDNRFMGKFFARWVAEVLAAYGKKVKFFDFAVPTPVIAHQTQNAPYGIMISASHNPYYYNGLKIFCRGGRELDTETALALQKMANKVRADKIKTLDFVAAKKLGAISVATDANQYIAKIKKQIRKQNPSVNFVFDAMHGSSTTVAQKLFDALGANAQIIRGEVDANFGFGLPAPYKHNLVALAKKIQSSKAQFGVAVDGDGDRANFMDEKGKFYDCNYIAALLYDDMCKNGQACDFVKNCAMTNLIDKIAQKYNQRVIVAKTGFKNTAIKMLENPNANIGAESNGVALRQHILFKDGVFLALWVWQLMCKTQKPLSKQIAALKKRYNFPCEVVEYAYPVDDAARARIERLLFTQKQVPMHKGAKIAKVSYDDGVKITYEDGYWGVLRFSGNENVLRLFAEMPTQDAADALIKTYEKFVGVKTRQT